MSHIIYWKYTKYDNLSKSSSKTIIILTSKVRKWIILQFRALGWKDYAVMSREYFVIVVVQSPNHVQLFCNPMDYSLLAFSVHGISQARTLGVGYHFLLQGIFLTWGSNPHHCTGRQVLCCWDTREALGNIYCSQILSHQMLPRYMPHHCNTSDCFLSKKKKLTSLKNNQDTGFRLYP